ncbi:MAG: FIST N-terminal domain-containing protein [Verrucomicrobiota bacterium]
MKARAVSRLVSGMYREDAVRTVAKELRDQLKAPPTLGLLYFSPDYARHAAEFLEVVRLYAQVPVLAGCSGMGLMGTSEETERRPGFSLMLLHLPGCEVTPFAFDEALLNSVEGPEDWVQATGLAPDEADAWLALINPFEIPADEWLESWNEAYPDTPTFGGLASGRVGESEAHLILNGERIEAGGLALALRGVDVEMVVSQGCRPIGEPLTVTSAEENIMHTLGHQPAFEVLNTAYESLTEQEKEHAQGSLFAGLALSEYVDEYKRGDFLVRNIIGADPNAGSVALAALVRPGQTVQYHLRDANAAKVDLRLMLEAARKRLGDRQPLAACVFTCTGRGRGLFGTNHHDAGLLDQFFRHLPAAGFFANGEIGPVAGVNYVHGYTASIALLLPKEEVPSGEGQ